MAGTKPLNEEAVPHTEKPHGALGGGYKIVALFTENYPS